MNQSVILRLWGDRTDKVNWLTITATQIVPINWTLNLYLHIFGKESLCISEFQIEKPISVFKVIHEGQGQTKPKDINHRQLYIDSDDAISTGDEICAI